MKKFNEFDNSKKSINEGKLNNADAISLARVIATSLIDQGLVGEDFEENLLSEVEAILRSWKG